MNRKPSFVVPALVGGVFLGITSALPLVNLINCFCCALIIGGGLIASFLYLRSYPPELPPMDYGDAAVLGVLTGVFGGLVWTIVDVPLTLFQLQLGMNFANLGPILEEALSDPNIPPEVRAMILEAIAGGGVTLGVMIFEVLVSIIFSVIFAVLGSIIGVAIFQPRRPPTVPPTAVQQPTPPADPTHPA